MRMAKKKLQDAYEQAETGPEETAKAKPAKKVASPTRAR